MLVSFAELNVIGLTEIHNRRVLNIKSSVYSVRSSVKYLSLKPLLSYLASKKVHRRIYTLLLDTYTFYSHIFYVQVYKNSSMNILLGNVALVLYGKAVGRRSDVEITKGQFQKH